MVTFDEDEYLAHYGTPRHSGRYPWGSGGNESNAKPRNPGFLDKVKEMRKQGLTDTLIAKGLGLGSTTELRAQISIEKTAQKMANVAMAQALKDKGNSNVGIGKRMGVPESTVRSWLAAGVKENADRLHTIAGALREKVAEVKYLDVGIGVENHLGVSKERLATAVAILKSEGYVTHNLKLPQTLTEHETSYKVLAPPGTTWGEVRKNADQIQQFVRISNDGGRTKLGIVPPLSIDSKRLQVKYAEDGGGKADGVTFVRRGVKDVSLGKSSYAQVRILIDGTHYVKGMAIYKDDLPPGVDLQFNTSKEKAKTKNKLDALKPVNRDKDGKIDLDNPFGALINNQITETKGKKEVATSAMNMVYEQGKWSEWSKTISAQVLSKQSPQLARQQLDITYKDRKRDLDEIMALTNPTVKRKLLESYADDADSASVHMKAARLPRQAWHAILPISNMPPNQIYAPRYNDGETVSLIRYPHGGTFEIPTLVVNNKHPGARKVLGLDPPDVVGIHHSVAEHLSGADFDGDTVLVIPNRSGKIKATPALEGLKGFDPRAAYPGYPGMKVMKNTQNEMGQISNLITDMTIKGASHDKIARAVRHSMVVIDAEKHKLNYKESYVRNGIKQLKEEYQAQPDGKMGAATLISRAKSEQRVEKRKPRPASEGGAIDPKTGKKVYVPTGEVHYKTGKPRTMASVKVAETDDAHTLSSGTVIEKIYADHSNRLKGLANQARVELLNTPTLKYSPTAAKAYPKEVAALNSMLDGIIRNRPLERQANIIANATVRDKLNSNPNMDKPTLKKIKYQATTQARLRTGAKRDKIDLTPEMWEAIQAGAISDNKLDQLLTNLDVDVIRQLATPRAKTLMSGPKLTRAKAMLASGNYTMADIALQLGVSLSTLERSVGGD